MPTRSIITGPDGSIVKGLTSQRRGGAGATTAAAWYATPAVANLTAAFDFTQRDGASVLGTDVNGGVITATDISGNGNDVTHWRTAGNSEIAKIHADGDAIEMKGPTEEHFGFRADLQFDRPPANSYHWFTVLTALHELVGGTAGQYLIRAPSGGTSIHYDFPVGGSTNPGGLPFLNFDAGSNAISDYNVNLTRLNGMIADGSIPEEKFALVEVRNSALDIEVELWVNGFKIDTTADGGGNPFQYAIWGKRDLNNPCSLTTGKLAAIGFGKMDDGGTDFTKAMAADVRAALMADFGIETWDGSTYPS